MIFKDIVDLALNSIDETDYDEQVEIIVKNAINKAYADLCIKDKRLTRAFIPIINSIATLPTDNLGIERITPSLDSTDSVIGNSIITNKSGMFEVLYSYLREPLINDDDEPDLHLSLQYALATYACYKYFEYRKKVEVAQSFLNNYDIEVYKFEQDNSKCVIDTIQYFDMCE